MENGNTLARARVGGEQAAENVDGEFFGTFSTFLDIVQVKDKLHEGDIVKVRRTGHHYMKHGDELVLVDGNRVRKLPFKRASFKPVSGSLLERTRFTGDNFGPVSDADLENAHHLLKRNRPSWWENGHPNELRDE